jgi:hypothetical protein
MATDAQIKANKENAQKLKLSVFLLPHLIWEHLV